MHAALKRIHHRCQHAEPGLTGSPGLAAPAGDGPTVTARPGTTPLVLDALEHALFTRAQEGVTDLTGLVAHSDAGSQYTSIAFTTRLLEAGVDASVGSVGDAYDNALMESINGLYKAECIRTTIFQPGPYKTLADVEYATAGWVEWYNNRRLHSSLAMTTPAEYETAYYAALNRELAPT